MTLIKLCGMMLGKDIEMANRLNPEYIGFVFWEKSHRNVSIEKARELKSELNKNIKAVGVFVDADLDLIGNLYTQGIIDMAQLHGSEGQDYIEKLKANNIPTIKAFRIGDKSDLEMANASNADFILLDAGKGQGRAFDWDLLKDFERPYFLAGGLNVANVKEAITRLHPFAVDVSSGIETDKKKDPVKMEKFVEMVRQ